MYKYAYVVLCRCFSTKDYSPKPVNATNCQCSQYTDFEWLVSYNPLPHSLPLPHMKDIYVYIIIMRILYSMKDLDFD